MGKIPKYEGKRATEYDSRRSGSVEWFGENGAVLALLKALAFSPMRLKGIRVLDCPCGTGRLREYFQYLSLESWGVDISEDMLHEARSKGFYSFLEQGDLLKGLRYDDGFFTLSICLRFLNWLDGDEMEVAVRELCRLSRNVIVGVVLGEDEVDYEKANKIHSRERFWGIVRGLGYEMTEEVEVTEGYGIYLIKSQI